MHGKLKTWKDRIKANFYGQDVPCDMYCNATAVSVLNTDSVYKQSKNYHLQVYIKECQYNDAGNQQCNILSNDNRFFEV